MRTATLPTCLLLTRREARGAVLARARGAEKAGAWRVVERMADSQRIEQEEWTTAELMMTLYTGGTASRRASRSGGRRDELKVWRWTLAVGRSESIERSVDPHTPKLKWSRARRAG